MKNVVCLLLTLALFSCSIESARRARDEQVRMILNSAEVEKSNINTTDPQISVINSEELPDNDAESEVNKDEILKEVLKNSAERMNDMDLPIYKEANSQVKKVERKKILVKPLTNLENDPYNLTDSELIELVESIKGGKQLNDENAPNSKLIDSLIDNYKNILKTSQVCCISNMTESFKSSNLTSAQILEIFRKDIDNAQIQDRCLILSEDEVYNSFDDKDVSKTAVKAREVCICNNKTFLRKNLNNFYRLYNIDSAFYHRPLIHRYKNKYGRIVEDEVNQAILNIASTLESCP